MKKILFIILGVIVAYLTTMILSSSTTYLLRSLFEVASSENPPFYYLAFDLTYAMFYIGVGAYAGTWVGKHKLTFLVYGGINVLFNFTFLITGMDAIHPLWYQITATLLAFPMAYIGGQIKLKNIKAKNQNSSAETT